MEPTTTEIAYHLGQLILDLIRVGGDLVITLFSSYAFYKMMRGYELRFIKPTKENQE